MASPYAGADVFPSTILCPDDGESRSAAAQNIPDQGLADRSVWLQTRRTEDQVKAAAAKLVVDLLPVLNFRTPVAQSFVHGVWNPTVNAWFAIETTTVCRASFDVGWSWGTNQITGADTLYRIASDADGNMVITTGVTSGAIHEFNAGTSTWTRRTASVFGGGSFLGVVGKIVVAYDPVAALWFQAGINNSPAQIICATSPDRVTWTVRSVPTSGYEVLLDLAVGNGTMVLVGRYNVTGVTHIWTSANGGASWTARSDIAHGFTTGTTNEVVYNAAEGLFMHVVGTSTTSCKVYTSPDGVTWTARATSVTKGIAKLSVVGAVYVAQQSQGSILFSLDSGVTWKQTGFQGGTPVSLVTSGAQLLAICSSSSVYPGFVAGLGGVTAL